MCTDGDQYGSKAFGHQFVEAIYWCVQLEFDAEVEDILDLALDNLCWQAEFGYADPQHAASHRQCLVDGDTVAQPTKVLGRSQAAGSSTDDGDAFVMTLCDRLQELSWLSEDGISNKAL